MKDCEKLAQYRNEWDAIMMFIEWLQQNHMCIGVWRTKKQATNEKGEVKEHLLEHPYPYGQTIENLLYQYFDVNPEKLERERREILVQLATQQRKEEKEE